MQQLVSCFSKPAQLYTKCSEQPQIEEEVLIAHSTIVPQIVVKTTGAVSR